LGVRVGVLFCHVRVPQGASVDLSANSGP
jgi:hypothetical protein